jgi:hypothetical protein
MSLKESMCCKHPLRSYTRLFLSIPSRPIPSHSFPHHAWPSAPKIHPLTPEHSSNLASSYTRKPLSPSLSFPCPALPFPSLHFLLFFITSSTPHRRSAHVPPNQSGGTRTAGAFTRPLSSQRKHFLCTTRVRFWASREHFSWVIWGV